MIEDRRTQALLTVVGVSAGVATGVWLWRRSREEPEYGPAQWERPRGLAQEVASSLRRDGTLGRRAIEVDAVAEGVIELSGTVNSREEADRAVGVAQRSTGVYTVVNRLLIEEEESRRAENQRRRASGAPEFQSRGHSGMGVGMGTRRQSPDTDPDRPSDKQKILDRSLDVANVEDTPEGGQDPISGAEAVESTRVKPGDEMAVLDAGLDPSPRPNSTPRESVAMEGSEAGSEEAGEESPEESGEEAERS